MSATPERRVKCLRFIANDGEIVRIAIHPTDITMSNSEVYVSPQIGAITDRNTVLDGGATVIDVGSVYDVDIMTQSEIQSGKWDNARVYHFATDWGVPVEDEEPLNLFTLGKVKESDGRFVIELMGEKDKLNQTVGRVHEAKCSKVFADTHLDGEVIIASDLYKCNIAPGGVTVTGSITTDVDNSSFIDSSRVEAEDYFAFGEIIFTTGNNAGLGRRTVKEYNVDGTITCNYPWYFTPEIGDQYQMIAGCRKRFDEDCGTKWSNKINFGGKPHVPTSSQVIKVGGQS